MDDNSTVDGFLWQNPQPERPAASKVVSISRIELPRFWAHGTETEVIDVTPVRRCEPVVPAGMFDQWPLNVLLAIEKPFAGLVVLIDIVSNQGRVALGERHVKSTTALVAGLLGENDFGCRTPENEFVVVLEGLEGADAQRRLNLISEQLWEYQQSNQGAFSLLFSWGGLGPSGKPFSEALASAIRRMNRINHNRRTISMRSVSQHRKTV